MGCATGTIKYALFIFNILWAILGILIIVFGILGWDAMPSKYAIGIIILGSSMLIISSFGCCGALRESAHMLWVYATFLFVLLILIVIFMCLSTRDVFKNYALHELDQKWQQELKKPGAMDHIQTTYLCCGYQSAEDYYKILRSQPASCCKEQNCINPLNLYLTGCITKISEAFADEPTITKYYQWGLLAFDLIIFILATILAIHFTNRKRRYNY